MLPYKLNLAATILISVATWCSPSAAQAPALPMLECERVRAQADESLYSRAARAVIEDAAPFARGRQFRINQAYISAAHPTVVCGTVEFETLGGQLFFVYVDGQVRGRWRDPSGPQELRAQLCAAPPRSCWIAR